MAGIFSSGFATFGPIVGILALIAAIWVIYDVLANNKRVSDIGKFVWIICAIFFSIITAIVYLVVYKTR